MWTFPLHEFFSLPSSLHEFFLLAFSLAWIVFFVFPHPSHHFSNGPSLRKGLPQGDALCPRLVTVCLNPIAWKISASEGYRLSKPIGTTVTDLLYIDDLKIFAASESKLSSVMNPVRAAMQDVGLIWNPKKCAVAHFMRGVRVDESTGLLMSDGNVKTPTLEDG